MLKTRNKLFWVISSLVVIVFTLCRCISKNEVSNDFRGNNFAGSAKCASCHKGVHDTYSNTAHFKTSALATKATVLGSFDVEKNTYFYKPEVKVVMEQRDSSLYQVAYANNVEKQANRFDVVMGSGTKAQTYLYWMERKAYQLPVSYYLPANSWVNSPGYPAHQVRFDRNIPLGCFECHSSYIKLEGNEVLGDRYINNFDNNRIIYGIDCERCHGPAAQHVTFHQQNPKEKISKYMTAYTSMSRVQQVDMCAVCHSGLQETLKSTFDFRPGDTLTNNFFTNTAAVKVEDLDVHGNQKQLLAASQCYIQSSQLNCTSCHNVHENERGNKLLFSKQCLSCHNDASHTFCKLTNTGSVNLAANCIDCHMPSKPSKLIQLLSNGQQSPTPNLIRTHYISIYPEETKKTLSSLKSK